MIDVLPRYKVYVAYASDSVDQEVKEEETIKLGKYINSEGICNGYSKELSLQ